MNTDGTKTHSYKEAEVLEVVGQALKECKRIFRGYLQYLDEEDIRSAGVRGFFEARRKFPAGSEDHFRRYAWLWVIGAMKRYIKKELKWVFFRGPCVDDYGITVKNIDRTLGFIPAYLWHGTRDPEEIFCEKYSFTEILSLLPPKERKVAEYMLLGYKPSEIAKKLGSSRNSIYCAVARLKQRLERQRYKATGTNIGLLRRLVYSNINNRKSGESYVSGAKQTIYRDFEKNLSKDIDKTTVIGYT